MAAVIYINAYFYFCKYVFFIFTNFLLCFFGAGLPEHQLDEELRQQEERIGGGFHVAGVCILMNFEAFFMEFS